jgi:protein N-terminal amidase
METVLTFFEGTGFASFSFTLPPSNSNSEPSTQETTSHKAVPVSLGICMDLNPNTNVEGYTGWPPEAGPYELADHSLRKNSRILILLNNWLDPDADQDEDGAVEGEDIAREMEDDPEPAWSTLEYWGARLRPLWVVDKHRRKGSDESIYSDGTASSDENKGVDNNSIVEDKPPHETIVVVCNRTGRENGKRCTTKAQHSMY